MVTEDLQAFATRAAAVSETDQVLAAVTSMAEQVAVYYRQLVKSDVPKALASELTLQAASYVWGGSACCHEGEG
jgi:hypothetical protein